MRLNGVLIIGLLVLAFTAVGFYGNFVQWSDVEMVTAKILNAKKQWVLKGNGHVDLEISATSARYDADEAMWCLDEGSLGGGSGAEDLAGNGQPPSDGDVASRAAPEK